MYALPSTSVKHFLTSFAEIACRHVKSRLGGRSPVSIEPTVVVDNLLFPESPRWHEGALWFSDMYAGRVCRYEPGATQLETVLELDDRPSGIGWLPDGRMLVVSMAERRMLRLEPLGLTLHADLRPFVTGDANDAVVGPGGRAYVGNFGAGYAEGSEVQPANLVIVEPDGQARPGPGGLLFPNGTVITPDGKRMIIAEGFRRQLTEFDIAEGGALVNRRVFAELDEIPDGVALDEAGGVWVALPLGQEFIRVDPGGNVTSRISVAPYGAFACALGGWERRTLFMCVALGTPEEIRNRASRGRIVAAPIDPGGCGWP